MSKFQTKRAVRASVVAVGAVFATGAAYATGTVAPIAPVLYAIEDVGATTTVTMPNVVYTMGVGRATGGGQDFVIIYTLPAGVTFHVAPAAPTLTSADVTSSITVKRGGAGTNQIVYSVTVGTGNPISAGDTITLVAPQLDATGLQNAGATVNMQVALLDQGETACVDNVGAAGPPPTCFLTSAMAAAANAVDYWNTFAVPPAPGVWSNIGNTTTDVNATVPLAGFVGTGAITQTSVQVKTSDAGGASVRNHTNLADYAIEAVDTVGMTVTDPTGFLGLKTNGLWYDFTGTGVQLSTGTVAAGNNTLTISGVTGTLAGMPGTSGGFNANRLVTYTSDAVTPMGVSRVLSIAGSVTPATGTGTSHQFTGNSTWWTWGSNGTVLETPWFTTYSGYISRFAFMNYGTNTVTYTAVCLAETGNTVTPGAAAAGTLAAGKETVITATDVCTMSGNTRAAVRFTINAPNSVVKGVYNVVNASSGSISATNMWRPGSN